MHRYFLVWGVAIGAAAISVSAPAQQPTQIAPAGEAPASSSTQKVEPKDAERRRAAGVQVGSFRFDSGLVLSQSFDDNIFATKTDRRHDWITTVAPYATLKSEWERHALNLDASGAFGRYSEFSSEDFNDYSVGADGRIDLAGRSNVFGGARYSRRHESRESPDAVNGKEPTVYDDIETHIGTFQQFDRITMRFGGTFEHLNFRDVPGVFNTINNDDRDRSVYETGVRIGYLVNRAFEPFVQAAGNWRRYDNVPDDFSFRRNSQGFGANIGVKYNSGAGLSGEVYMGQLHQSYADARFKDVNAVDFGALVSWIPVRGTRIRLSVDRTLEETTVVGASGYISTATRASVEHAVTRAFLLLLNASYVDLDFESVDRNDLMIGFGAGFRYFFLPNVFIGLEDRFLKRDSSVEDGNFDENQIILSVGAQLSSGYRDGPSSLSVDQLGLYGGFQVSHGFVGTEFDGPRGAGGSLVADFGDDGYGGGLFAGFGGTVDKWYLGFEIDGDSSEAEWQHARLPGGRVFSVDKGPSVAGTLRFGRWLPGGALLYARAGVAYAEFDSFYMTPSSRVFEQTDGRFGVRVGAGVEFALAERLFGRFDYTVTDYRDYDVTIPSGSDTFNNTETLARLGIGYRLQGVPAGSAPTDGKKPSYSGAYVGARVGYGTVQTENSGERVTGSAPLVTSVLTADRGSHGPGAGIFAGYGVTLGDVYIAAELEGDVSDTEWRQSRDPTGRVYSVQKNESFGASARLGYVLPFGTLVYARAGVVRTTFRTKYAYQGVSVDQDDRQTGLRFGGGIETPVSDSLFLRVDYTHTAYGSYSLNYGSGVDTFENDENLAQIGVAYRF